MISKFSPFISGFSASESGSIPKLLLGQSSRFQDAGHRASSSIIWRVYTLGSVNLAGISQRVVLVFPAKITVSDSILIPSD